MSVRVSGTEGYAEAADELVERYESISFADCHRPVLHLIPRLPGRILDIGAGTGRDAAALAEMGHTVLAVEPTAAFRDPCRKPASLPRNRMAGRQPAGIAAGHAAGAGVRRGNA
jgi:protein-L-isoaspartate O-methyltransferase